MFICSYTVSALLPDSWAAPKEEAYISRKGALLRVQRLNVKGMYSTYCSRVSLERSLDLS